MLELLDVLSLDLLAQVPSVGSDAPPGLGPVTSTVLSWIKWLSIMFGIGGIIVIAIMMMIGRRNRSQMAADGLSALPWIVGGFILIGISTALAQGLLDAGNVDTVEFGNSAPAANTNAPNPNGPPN